MAISQAQSKRKLRSTAQSTAEQTQKKTGFDCISCAKCLFKNNWLPLQKQVRKACAYRTNRETVRASSCLLDATRVPHLAYDPRIATIMLFETVR